MNDTIDGKVVTIVRFSKNDIQDIFGDLTETQYQYVADVLAANVEFPTINKQGYVELSEENFNDCFEDMLSELEDLLYNTIA